MKNERIEVGQIVGVHGILGEVKIQHWCDEAEIFLGLKQICIKGEWHRLLSCRLHKNVILAKVEGITDRTAAEALRMCVLEAERNQLPPLPEGRYYICDLVGLAVKTDEGRLLGRLSDVLETGSNQVYEVTEDTTKKKYYLPVIDPVILSTDLEGGLLTVHLLEGLIDE